MPNLELPDLLGCATRDGAVAVDDYQQSTAAGVYCAGEITGVGGADLAIVEGRIAGLSAVGKTEEAARHFAAGPRPPLRQGPSAPSASATSCETCPTTIHSYAVAKT